MEEDLCSDCPQTTVKSQSIDAVRAAIEDDPYSTYIQIEMSLDINSPPMNSILHDHLNFRKVCAQWVLQQLTNAKK
jgi:hypothetical protein